MIRTKPGIFSVSKKNIVQMYHVARWRSRWAVWEFFNLQEAITPKRCFRRPTLRKHLFLQCVVDVPSGCRFFVHPVCKRYVCVCTAVRVSENTLGRIIICFVPLKCFSYIMSTWSSTVRRHEVRRLETVLWIVVRDLYHSVTFSSTPELLPSYMLV